MKKKEEKKETKGRDSQYGPCFCEGVAGRRLATPAHKTAFVRLSVSTGLHVNAGVQGFRGLWFRVRVFRSLGFRVQGLGL